ncbi:MAG: uroporphyrinogen-III synthase [Bacteroidota bacterium]
MKIKSILVSQPKPETEKNPYFEISKKFCVKIDFRQFIRIEGIPSRDFRKDRIGILDFSAVIFTSKNAVNHFFRICTEMRVTVPETLKYFCVTESIAYYLQKFIVYRKRKIFYGKQKFSDLVDIVKKHKTERFLVPCSDIHKQEISKLLDENKINYTKAIIYRTLASDLSDLGETPGYDMLVFFSPSGIKSLFKNFPKFKQNTTVIAAFGPTTAKAVIDAGLRLDVEAPTPQAPSMTMAIDQFLKKTNKK